MKRKGRKSPAAGRSSRGSGDAGRRRSSAGAKKAALEMSAQLAVVSLKVSRAFIGAVPEAEKILSIDEIRQWAEMGRRVAMADSELGARFFTEGVAGLAAVCEESRSLVFEICTRQLVLSSSIALKTFHTIPELAIEIDDEELYTKILGLAREIANRSAKHSADFLAATTTTVEAFAGFGDARDRVADACITLAREFAGRTGGMTADLWAELPRVLEGLSAADAVRLMGRSREILAHGGSVTLHFVGSGAVALRRFEGVFDGWCEVAEEFARHGNAVLIAFLRSTPGFFRHLASLKKGSDGSRAAGRILRLVSEVAKIDPESALAAFRSSAKALSRVTLRQYEDWVRTGLETKSHSGSKARRSFFALETRRANELLTESDKGLSLEQVQTILRVYVEGLTGREVEVAPLSAMPEESRIGDGKVIYLPSVVKEFEDSVLDFRLYKVLAAHGAGQIEFGTFVRDTLPLRAAFEELSALYLATPEQLDAFSLAGYIEEVEKGEPAMDDKASRADEDRSVPRLPAGSDYRVVLRAFPDYGLARKIFGTMENARIDRRLRSQYRGLVKDLDLMQAFLRDRRPYIFDLPVHQVPFELLFQITMCGGATDDAKQFYGQVTAEIESVIGSYLGSESSTVADSIIATSRVYTLFQNISPDETKAEPAEDRKEPGEIIEEAPSGESVAEARVRPEELPDEASDIRDVFNAWNAMDDVEGAPDDIQGSENWSFNEMPEQPLEAGDLAYSYDEWDRELADFRTGWCRVIEKRVRTGDRNFVQLARSRYRGVISSVRHQFQLMKPENLTRINRELDGEEYDLNAVIDYVVDKRADGQQSERIYTKRLRRERDVAVSFLLDQSSSTARTITRNPLQPYTHPGRRIIEIEKEGLVLMSEALEAVGDIYSINGFTSEGRRNVKFFVVKDFDENYSEDIEKRIGGITFQNNTRLGAAIRHSSTRLLTQDSRTKLMIILTDGRPYDHDYGDAKYAREDVREALTEAKMSGITPFCITIDRDSEQELKDLYGEVGYTIIDDVLSLPERLPNIYRRLTS